MSAILDLAKKTPGLKRLHGAVVGWISAFRMRANPTEFVFTDIFERRLWGDGESISGPGSDLEQTRALANSLPTLLGELNVTSLLDLPCGDFHWMSHVPLNGVEYVGADIVKSLIRKNTKAHEREGVSFRQLNLLKDPLPRVDLIFCRDCLVHLCLEDVQLALERFGQSGARFVLTTHFPATLENLQIETGDWRPLNLEAAPFHLPAPLRTLSEECTLEGGVHGDKVMGLWRIKDVEAAASRWGACADDASSS